MVHNPGGDWNPGRGDNPSYIIKNRKFGSIILCKCDHPRIDKNFYQD